MDNKHTNSLIHQTSPYLLQHAHNPVNWYAWGKEALDAAKTQDKPILVSIGYAACHWCHVMEKESFEDEATAAVMNAHFINIKIDREERPDLDHIYMDAVQAIAGSGGWPLNVFLTPDTKPFYGGTYFPPQPAFNRPSWKDVLASIHESWKKRRDEIETQAETLIEHIRGANNFAALKPIFNIGDEKLFDPETAKTIAEQLLKNADNIDGGFGKPPKFLQTFSIRYLLQQAYFSGDAGIATHAEFSLRKMINGGIYDQLAGGISRYSTDAQWLAPHFEKMLYDNALLITTLCDALRFTKNECYKNAIEKTFTFLQNEMKHPSGGYYAALDADSEGIEGKFYVWTKQEIETLLGKDAEAYNMVFNVSAVGNWEEKNILHITADIASIAGKLNMPENELHKLIARSNAILLTERNKRIRPATDDKILLGWNALLITAFCKSFAATGESKYLDAAVELFECCELMFTSENTQSLAHTYKNGRASIPAFLDDYAYFIEACIHLQEVTSNQDYLLRSQELLGYVLEEFADAESGYFFYTGRHQTDIIVRKIEMHDGATPSANAVMAFNLFYLSVIFNNSAWYEKAVFMLKGIEEAVKKYPASFAVWASLLSMQAHTMVEIVVTGPDINALKLAVLSEFIPGSVFQSSEKPFDSMGLLRGKSFTGEALIYVCRQYACSEPVKDAGALKEALKNQLH